MNTDIVNYIVRTNEKEWTPLVEQGIDTKGIAVKVLHFDEQSHRAPSILLKFEAGAKYPYHNHPSGEELFVLAGEVTIEGTELKAGDYLYTPPNFKHAVESERGCILFFMIPQEVEII